jgi:hypothetical protein
MYFPYLFGRGSELLALRDVSDELPLSTTVVPILEPVKENTGDLKRCLNKLGSDGVRTVVVMNPREGDFRGIDLRKFRADLADLFAKYECLLPGFLFGPRNHMREVSAFCSQYPNKNLALLYRGPQLTDSELRAVIAEQRVIFHINRHDGLDPTQRALLPKGKAVDILDAFNVLDRNADYVGREFFTDSHLSFRPNAVGYGDYSIVGPIYHPGGGPAAAVAIHATFKNRRTGHIWVEHFVSDDVDLDVGSVGEKFHQAADKFVKAAVARKVEFGTNKALVAYASDVQNNHFPGLGVSKRRQIHHHIALNHKILQNEH